ncbi:venom allergen 3-like [Vanessa tameamea]|uniref:Venom allergen 3-like n=1 Tax=Vanessa tameamea TaxID=334116 RepID=A0ABM4AU33_VANTA
MGPTCSGAADVSVTPDFAQMILDIINRIRSKVAAGTAKGKDGINLPKGYGIYRLNWDEELATFAQVWANQCILKSDLCRDSKRFPKVGQTLGMSRFTIDDWQPLHSSNYLNSSTLTQDKVKYAITAVLKAWYGTRADITPEDIILNDDRHNNATLLMNTNEVFDRYDALKRDEESLS